MNRDSISIIYYEFTFGCILFALMNLLINYIKLLRSVYFASLRNELVSYNPFAEALLKTSPATSYNRDQCSSVVTYQTRAGCDYMKWERKSSAN